MARNKKEECPKGSPEWMNTYADLVTLLFCFFVLLYSMSNIDIEKFQSVASSFNKSGDPTLLQSAQDLGLIDMLNQGLMEMPIQTINEDEIVTEEFKNMQEELTAMYDDFKTYFDENAFSEKVDVVKQTTNLDLTFKDNILFDKGKDVIKNDAMPILDSISALLSVKYPNTLIEVVGHTDNDPINNIRFPNNWYLSSARAINVGSFFINQKNFSPQRIYAGGRGEFDPIAPNDTEENKSKNRRVQIRIYSSFADAENK